MSAREIGATSDQEAKIHDIIATNFDALAPSPGDRMEMRKAALDLLRAPTIDRAAVEKLRADYVTAEAVHFDSIDEVYADDQPWFASDEPSAFDQLAEGEMRARLITAITSRCQGFSAMGAQTAMSSRPPLRSIDVVNTFLSALIDQGFTDKQAVNAYRSFSSFLLGQLLLESAVRGG